MFHVKDDFKPSDKIFNVGCDWFNKVGSFLNHLVGSDGLMVEKPNDPSETDPPTIRNMAGASEGFTGDLIILTGYGFVCDNGNAPGWTRQRVSFNNGSLIGVEDLEPVRM